VSYPTRYIPELPMDFRITRTTITWIFYHSQTPWNIIFWRISKANSIEYKLFATIISLGEIMETDSEYYF